MPFCFMFCHPGNQATGPYTQPLTGISVLALSVWESWEHLLRWVFLSLHDVNTHAHMHTRGLSSYLVTVNCNFLFISILVCGAWCPLGKRLWRERALPITVASCPVTCRTKNNMGLCQAVQEGDYSLCGHMSPILGMGHLSHYLN